MRTERCSRLIAIALGATLAHILLRRGRPRIPLAMILSASTRRRLYVQGKLLLGEDGMALLRARAIRTAGRVRALRRRLSRARHHRRRRPLLDHIESVPLDADHCLVTGRLDPAASSLVAFALRFPDGRERDVMPKLVRFANERARSLGDDSTHGFAMLLAVTPDEVGDARLVARNSVGSVAGRGCAIAVAHDEADDALLRVRRALALLARATRHRRALLDAVIGPSIDRIWNAELLRRHAGDSTATTTVYNDVLSCAAPEVSVIVPIYGRHDFIAHQLTAFSGDADFATAELIYVIDDPRLRAPVAELARRCAALHDVCFTVLQLETNLGYAGANNVAARLARGRRLMLLNSDVLPVSHGWLSSLVARAGPPDDAVLGARLLYGEGTMQHDGMRFEPSKGHEGLWINRHPGKGIAADVFPVSAVAEEREAVTGACLLIGRERFDQLGGFDEGYILGDFEDSDLCLQARRAGMSIRIATDVMLYHLERQSQSMVSTARWKDDLTHYNCWRHTARWHETIIALKRGDEPPRAEPSRPVA